MVRIGALRAEVRAEQEAAFWMPSGRLVNFRRMSIQRFMQIIQFREQLDVYRSLAGQTLLQTDVLDYRRRANLVPVANRPAWWAVLGSPE